MKGKDRLAVQDSTFFMVMETFVMCESFFCVKNTFQLSSAACSKFESRGAWFCSSTFDFALDLRSCGGWWSCSWWRTSIPSLPSRSTTGIANYCVSYDMCHRRWNRLTLSRYCCCALTGRRTPLSQLCCRIPPRQTDYHRPLHHPNRALDRHLDYLSRSCPPALVPLYLDCLTCCP